MNPVYLNRMLRTTISMLIIAMLSAGGCDIEFGGTGTDSGGNGSITGEIIIEGEIVNFAEFG